MPLPRFTRQTGIQTQGVTNPSAGADFDVLANELERFNERRNTQLDQMAAEEGFQEGQAAGEAGAAPVDQARTIRDQAFNRGAILAHQAGLQTDIRDSVGRFAIENPTDPEAFDAQVRGLESGLLEDAPAQLHTFVRQRVADYAGRAKLNILDAQRQELARQAAEDLQKGAEGFLGDARTAAFEGDITLVEARRQELEELLGQGVEGEILGEDDATGIMRTFEKAVIEQEVLGNFDRTLQNDGIDAGTAAIERWQKIKPTSVGLDVDEHQAVLRQLRAARSAYKTQIADQLQAQAEAERKLEQDRRGRVADAINVMQRGFQIDQDQMRQVTEDINALGDPDLAADFDVGQAIHAETQRFRRIPAAQRDAELQNLRRSLLDEGANQAELDLLDALTKTDNAVSQAVDKDPLGFLLSEGLRDDKPLNFSSGVDLAESLQERAQSGQGAEIIGQAVPLLTAQEAENFAAIYDAAEIPEKVSLLGVMAVGAGDRAEATLSQLDVAGHTQMAMLGSMVLEGRAQLAQDIMRGGELLTAGQIKSPTPIEMAGEIDRTLGAAYIDAPERREDYIQAAVQKYAQMVASDNEFRGVFDPKMFRRALEQVAPTAEFNGFKVGLPAGLSEDAFDDWAESWTAETFEGVAGIGGQEMLDLLQDRGRLTELGNGRYGVLTNSALTRRDKVVVLEDGSPLILTVPRESQ